MGSGPIGDDDSYHRERGPQRQHGGPLRRPAGRGSELAKRPREGGGEKIRKNESFQYMVIP